MDLTKGVPAKIHLETTINQNGETEQHVFDEDGKVVQMGATYYIRYQETYESVEVPVTVKIEPHGVVTIIRRGDMTTRLRFDQGERLETQYRTPQGIMTLETATRNIRISYTDRPFSGRLLIEYALYFGNQKLGEYNLQLLFTV